MSDYLLLPYHAEAVFWTGRPGGAPNWETAQRLVPRGSCTDPGDWLQHVAKFCHAQIRWHISTGGALVLSVDGIREGWMPAKLLRRRIARNRVRLIRIMRAYERGYWEAPQTVVLDEPDGRDCARLFGR